jgi:sugar lactone lactonase YvrE
MRSVLSIAPTGEPHVELQSDDRPFGLGWMPDGALIVVAMDTQTLLRRAPGEAAVICFADLSQNSPGVAGHLNDLVIDRNGNIYVGLDPDFTTHGFRSEFGSIIHIDTKGHACVAASGLHFPNGMVVTGDSTRLIVAETGAPRLTAFDIGPSGTLAQRSVWGLADAPSAPAVR